LKPNIDNLECWSGEKIGKQLEIAPGATANYELNYYPLSMTSEKTKHKYEERERRREREWELEWGTGDL
jgi:hypothetical protein